MNKIDLFSADMPITDFMVLVSNATGTDILQLRKRYKAKERLIKVIKEHRLSFRIRQLFAYSEISLSLDILRIIRKSGAVFELIDCPEMDIDKQDFFVGSYSPPLYEYFFKIQKEVAIDE